MVVVDESAYRDRNWTSSGSVAEAKQEPNQAPELSPEMDQAQGAAHHHDQLGSTRALTDSTGALVANVGYDPYGAVTVNAGAATTPLGYAGQYTDAESGLQYLRARYYEPATGQFLNCDPVADQTRDAFGYATRSPLNLSDPSGMATPGLKASPTPTLRYAGWEAGCWFQTASGWYQYDPDNAVEFTGYDRRHIISPDAIVNGRFVVNGRVVGSQPDSRQAGGFDITDLDDWTSAASSFAWSAACATAGWGGANAVGLGLTTGQEEIAAGGVAALWFYEENC